MKRTYFLFLLAIALVACGSNESKSSVEKETELSSSKNTVEEPIERMESSPAKDTVEVELLAIGEDMAAIAFEPKTLSIKAGTRVRLTFKNNSQAAGMYHNFVLVKLGKGQEVATAGMAAGKDKNFVVDGENVIAYTKVLDMGDSTVIEFDAPAKGSYHYICTYPGHYPNMIGRMNVE